MFIYAHAYTHIFLNLLLILKEHLVFMENKYGWITYVENVAYEPISQYGDCTLE